jgi:dihydroneopterin aldolase
VSGDRLTVTVRGLDVFGRHGVFQAERDLGQRFIVDLDIVLGHARSAATDDLADTVDYAALSEAVAAIVAGEPVALLEHLASVIAERVLAEPHAEAVTVTVHKPHVAIPQTVTETAVTLTRSRAQR